MKCYECSYAQFYAQFYAVLNWKWNLFSTAAKAMPNGFRHDVMIRRLALRLDTEGPTFAVRVALRQESLETEET